MQTILQKHNCSILCTGSSSDKLEVQKQVRYVQKDGERLYKTVLVLRNESESVGLGGR